MTVHTSGAENVSPNQEALDEMRQWESIYRDTPGIDCSEIAEDLFNASGAQGRIYEIVANEGRLHVEEYEGVDRFYYHTVFSDGTFIFDPRFSSEPILKEDYFEMINRLNPDGINIEITHP